MSRSVDYQFRILYALGIIFVVAGHCGGGGVSLIYDWFTPYAFHLGIFAFGSGYFYNIEESNHQISYIIKKFYHLIIPTYFCNILYGVLVYILRYDGFTIGGYFNFYNLIISPINSGHQFAYNLGTWFVAPLFMILVFNNFLFRVFKYIKYNLVIISILYIVLGVVSVHMARNGYNKSWYLVIDRMFFLMPMFSLGMIYKKYRFFDNIHSVKYFIVIFLIQLYMIYTNNGLKGNNIAWMINLLPGIKPFIIEFLGILFWLRVSRILEPLLKNSTLINYIGANTFAIMTHHLLGFMFVKFIFREISKFTPYFTDFNVVKYKTYIWYLYLPHGINQFKIIYLFAGIMIPLLIIFCVHKLVNIKYK